mgnify:FL=1
MPIVYTVIQKKTCGARVPLEVHRAVQQVALDEGVHATEVYRRMALAWTKTRDLVMDEDRKITVELRNEQG